MEHTFSYNFVVFVLLHCVRKHIRQYAPAQYYSDVTDPNYKEQKLCVLFAAP